MPKYRVDKKLFEQKVLEEQLKQVELQSKYLKDEPLKRSEVDEYNKLKAGGWVRNTLITLGVAFATAIALIVFTLLGNMLVTNGRNGNVGKVDINSENLYHSFKNSEYFPENPQTIPIGTLHVYVEYPVPYEWVDDKDTVTTSDDITYKFLSVRSHDVSVTYRLEWEQTYGGGPGEGSWAVGKTDGTIGLFTQSSSKGRDNDIYALDVKKLNLNELMTDWFKGQEDGLAKTLIEDFFYTAWPLTFVLWMVFLMSIAGYAVVLVVGIRYVIRTVIGVLRKAGYIVSDFATEVVESVKAEIPVIENEEAKEIDFSEMKKQIEEKLEKEKILNSRPDIDKSESITEPKRTEKIVAVTPIVEEKPLVEEIKKESTGKSAKDKVSDIFNME